MSGEDLYVEALSLLQNCGTDSWDELSDDDQEVWCHSAAKVEEQQ